MVTFDLSGLALPLLAAYIILDLIRNRGASPVRRVAVYTFVFYLLNVFQQTTGGLHIPPLPPEYRSVAFQPVPFWFVADWLELYRQVGPDWRFWYSVRLSMLNMVLLFPLGVYMPLLFRVHSYKKAAFFLALTSLGIELYQVIFSYTGMTMVRTFNADDILLNTLGGLAGLAVYRLLPQEWMNYVNQFLNHSRKKSRSQGED